MPQYSKKRSLRGQPAVIYGLINPCNNLICYVGMTYVEVMKSRWRSHNYDGGCDSPAKRELNMALRYAGQTYSPVILQQLKDSRWGKVKEENWIAQMLDAGAYLLNIRGVPAEYAALSDQAAADFHARACYASKLPKGTQVEEWHSLEDVKQLAGLPVRYGKAWTYKERSDICESFLKEGSLNELAQSFQRSHDEIMSILIKDRALKRRNHP